MKIIDAFIFYNEIDLLFYRLNILNDLIDKFVIVESKHTFTGKKKDLFFEDNKHLFSQFLYKIVHIVVDDMPHIFPDIDYNKKEQWNNEYYQRNKIRDGIDMVTCELDDIIILSDIDEIPDPNIIFKIKNNEINITTNSLEMDFYYYNLTAKCNDKWVLPKIIKYKYLNNTISNIRNLNVSKIINGGWHLSYFGDVNFIKNKLQNFSHQEFNKNEYTDAEKIHNRVVNYIDLFDRNRFNIIQKIEIKDNNYLPYEYDKYLIKFL